MNEGDYRRDWLASWVWAPGDEGPTNSYTYFRIEFDVAELGPHRLHLSADTRYRLWLNGRLIGQGPPPSVPHLTYYDSYDLTADLRSGTNCLAVLVRYVGPLYPWKEPARRGGFLAECDGPDGVILATGVADWRCQRATAWFSQSYMHRMNVFDPYQEVFDARREPVGWREVGFDDSRRPDGARSPAVVPGAASDGWHGDVRLGWWKNAYRPGDGGPGVWDEPQTVREVSFEPGERRLWATVVEQPIPHQSEAVQRAESVVSVEECLALHDVGSDLSVSLSQAGRSPQTTTVQDVESLVTGATPVVLACSSDHLIDRTVDGVRDPSVVVDFGREVTGYVELDVEGPAGAVVDIGVAERLVDGHFNNIVGGCPFSTRYVLRGGRQRWRSFAWRGFRYLRLRLSDTTQPVTVHDLVAVTTQYPFEERGQFSSSDARLNGIFEICRHTIRLCCHDSIIDTPWREQAQWLGDVALVTVRAINACFGDTALPGKFFRQAAVTQADTGLLANVTDTGVGMQDAESRAGFDIPDYSLWWVIGLLDHYRYSGDAEIVQDLFGVVRGVFNGVLAHQDTDGLVESFGWTLIDWAGIDRGGKSSAFNAILHGALHAGSQLAAVADASSDAQRWQQEAERLAASFATRFWDAERGVFVDAVGEDGVQSSSISEHGNFAAIRFGLLDVEASKRLARRLLGDEDKLDVIEAQPFFTTVVLDALRGIGETQLALDVITDRWGRRMLDRGATSVSEEWGHNGTWRSGTYRGVMLSTSHAWSAHPASFLIQQLAGIDIIEPGCQALRITPFTAGPDFDIVFPTPHGPVRVRNQSSQIAVDLPDGVRLVT